MFDTSIGLLDELPRKPVIAYGRSVLLAGQARARSAIALLSDAVLDPTPEVIPDCVARAIPGLMKKSVPLCNILPVLDIVLLVF